MKDKLQLNRWSFPRHRVGEIEPWTMKDTVRIGEFYSFNNVVSIEDVERMLKASQHANQAYALETVIDHAHKLSVEMPDVDHRFWNELHQMIKTKLKGLEGNFLESVAAR